MSRRPSATGSRCRTATCWSLHATACLIEKHYGRAMDIEWGKDGVDGSIHVLQARPETVRSRRRAGAEEKLPP